MLIRCNLFPQKIPGEIRSNSLEAEEEGYLSSWFKQILGEGMEEEGEEGERAEGAWNKNTYYVLDQISLLALI